LEKFKKDPKNKGGVTKTGFWRYSRHPNYFGETLVWWGFYIISINAGGLYTIYSAITITLLLRFISGVPLLERKQMKKEDYKVYAKETNVFVPWFINKIGEKKDK
jgi:steroid 5-alpha reductase family enzyme